MEPETLPLFLHPEALFDALYERHELGTGDYLPISGPWSAKALVAGGLHLASGTARLRAECPAEGVLRLRWNPAGEVAESVTEKLGLIELPDKSHSGRREITSAEATLQASAMRFVIDNRTGRWQVNRDGTPLLAPAEGSPRFSPEPPTFGAGNRFLVEFQRQGEERFFGLGGRIAQPDRTGSSADMYAMKVGLYSGDYGGFPIPLVLSTRGYAVFLNNPWPHVYFDLARADPSRWWIHAPGGELDLFVIDGPEFADIVRRFTSLVGRIPHPKRWWLGFWVSALAFSSAEEVEDVARRLRDEDYPADAVVLDGPWRGGPDFLKL